MPKIGFAGLSHLGLCSALAAAVNGADVVAFDPDAARIALIARGDPGIHEPDYADLWARHQSAIQYSADPAALASCALIYISADVPTDDRGQSDLAPIEALIELIAPHLGNDAILCVLAQVPPGFTRGLKRAHAKLAYQVETLVFGQAMKRALAPERFILGLADPGAVPTALKDFLARFDCPILAMGFESAELSKIAINAHLAAQVSITNTLAELAEELGADWREIAPALRLDRRIGPHAYLKPGLGLSGGNIERDLAGIVRLGLEHGTDTSVVEAFIALSAHRKGWALRAVHDHVLSRWAAPTLAILGLAYKEDTHSIKNSPAIDLCTYLPWPLRAYDPMVPASVLARADVIQAKNALDAITGAQALVIMTPWAAFRDMTLSEIATRLAGDVVIDPHNVLGHLDFTGARLKHVTLGTGARPHPALGPPDA